MTVENEARVQPKFGRPHVHVWPSPLFSNDFHLVLFTFSLRPHISYSLACLWIGLKQCYSARTALTAIRHQTEPRTLCDFGSNFSEALSALLRSHKLYKSMHWKYIPSPHGQKGASRPTDGPSFGPTDFYTSYEKLRLGT